MTFSGFSPLFSSSTYTQRQEIKKVKITPLHFSTLRNFPNSFTPPFLVPRFPPGEKPQGKTAQETPAPHPRHTVTFPRQYKAPWELRILSPPRAAQPSSPAQSGGGIMVAFIAPPPRRRASPTQRQNRRGLFSPLHCVTLRSQTRPSTAQRGRGSVLPPPP
jgi:hypothetical protein